MSNKEHLTAATVEAIVKAGGRMNGNRLVREIGDLHTKGLELRVRSPGRAHWSMRYRINGVSRRFDIGPTSAVGLREARDAAAEVRSKLARNIDPVAEAEDARLAREQAQAAEEAERVAAAARITVAEAVQRYIAHSVRQSAKRQKGPPRERIRTLRVDVLPVLGDTKLADLSNDAVMALVSEAERQGFERKPSKLYDEMRAFLSWATAMTPKLLTTSPLTSPRPEQNAPRDRVLTVAEVRAFLTILPECPMTETVRDVCRLILRLGQRVNEVCRMRRRDLHLDDDYWAIPAAVAKNSRASRVPLPPAARRIIIEAVKRSGCEFVFPNKAGDGPLEPTVVAKALLRSQGKFEFVDDEGEPASFSTHDLRRTCATYVEKLGTPEKVIGRILNHKTIDAKSVTSQVYARDDLFDPAFDALCKWEVAIEQIERGADPFNVTVIDRRQRAEAIRQQMAGLAPLLPPVAK